MEIVGDHDYHLRLAAEARQRANASDDADVAQGERCLDGVTGALRALDGRGGDGARALPVAAADGDVDAFLGQPEDDGLAEARRSTGHERDLAYEPSHRSSHSSPSTPGGCSS